MKFTYFGHSCFQVEAAGKKLLFDPFITPNDRAKAIDVEQIEADYILISHAHFDHLADAEVVAKRTGAPIISNWEIVSWFGAKGLTGHPMNHGGAFSFPFVKVKYTIAHHSSSFPDGSYGGNPGGFLVETSEGAFYYSGDTALTYDMKLLGEAVALRFAVLPVGDNFTMGADDAARAAEFLNVKEVIGVHYDTFPPITIDHAAAKQAFEKRGKTLRLFSIGESSTL